MTTLATRSPAAERPANIRSAVTNKRRMFVEGDGRSPWSRRRKDLEALYADDLGGVSALTGFQLGLIATAATLRLELEQLEGKLSTGETVDLDKYSRSAGHYRRLCETLGLERRARDITPNPLAEHFSRPLVREVTV